MLQFLDQLDQRQTRLGVLGVIARIGNRNLETRSYYLRRFNDVFLAKEQVKPDRFAEIRNELEKIDKTAAKRLAKRSTPWVFAAERWMADPRLRSTTLSIDEDRTGVFLDLARRLGIISNTYSLTELGSILQDLVTQSETRERDHNPLLVQERIAEQAFFTQTLLLTDAVTPFYIRSLVRNARRPADQRKSELKCLPEAVNELLENARQGAGISHALAVRGILEYRDRLQSENAAWHNARPRLEFFMDLGLLKSSKGEDGRYAITEAGYRAAELWEPLTSRPRQAREILDTHFFGWFAKIHDLELEPLEDDRSRIGSMWRAFRKPIARPIGHTPARTLAFTACLDSLRNGHIVEVVDLLSTIRKAAHGEWSDAISFSGGSRLDHEILVRFESRASALFSTSE